MSAGSRRARRLRSGAALVALSTLVVPIAAACDTLSDSGEGTTTVERTVTEAPPATEPAEPTTTAASEPVATESTTQVEGVGPGFVWFAQADDGALRPVASLASDPTEVAEAIAAGTNEPDLVGGLPPGTAVQVVTLDGSTAIVDLSEDFVIGYQPGSAAETVAVAPLVYSLTELPNVEAVLITVDGAAPAPVGASFDFSRPLSRADIPAAFAEGFE